MAEKWLPLQSGDIVQIIAPASKSAQPEQDLLKVQQLLQQWQLVAHISPKIIGEAEDISDLANTDEQRFADLRDAILNSHVKAVWCLRGGYGTIRLLPYLTHYFKQAPPLKLFIGFSDITLLHHYFTQQWGWSTLHASGALQVAEQRVDTLTIEKLRQLLFGQINKIIIDDLLPMNKAASNQQSLNSSLTGGNLTLISRTLATPYALQTHNKILVLEDINEPFRKVDGILQQLTLAGYWQAAQKPAAIILGDFNVQQPLQQMQINTCLTQFAQQLDLLEIPVLRCSAIGHGIRNHPLPFATPAKLILGEKPVITVETGCRI